MQETQAQQPEAPESNGQPVKKGMLLPECVLRIHHVAACCQHSLLQCLYPAEGSLSGSAGLGHDAVMPAYIR